VGSRNGGERPDLLCSRGEEKLLTKFARPKWKINLSRRHPQVRKGKRPTQCEHESSDAGKRPDCPGKRGERRWCGEGLILEGVGKERLRHLRGEEESAAGAMVIKKLLERGGG